MNWIGFIKSDLFGFINHKPETTCLSSILGEKKISLLWRFEVCLLPTQSEREQEYLKNKNINFIFHIHSHLSSLLLISTTFFVRNRTTWYALNIWILQRPSAYATTSFRLLSFRKNCFHTTKHPWVMFFINFKPDILRKLLSRKKKRNIFIHNKLRYLLIAF